MISYRREDSAGWAGWIHDHLTSHFGKDEIFLDIDGIPVGEDFLQTITNIVTNSSAILVLIGQRWLESADENGKSRLLDEEDTLRVEIRLGLELEIPILPVLVDKAIMPPSSKLPTDIQALSFKNAHNIDPKQFKRDVDALIYHIETAIRIANEKKKAVPLEDKITELRKQLAIAEQALEKEREEFSDFQDIIKNSGETVEYKPSTKPFNAFISYNHSTDGQIATAVELGLSKFTKPWYKRRNLRIFRDETNLSIKPNLWSSIQEFIEKSEYMILVASPGSAKSNWVDAELNHWLKVNGSDSILIILTDGEIVWNESGNDFDWEKTSALPSSLRNKFKYEPLYIDLRWAKAKEDITLHNIKFSHAVAMLSATIQNRSLDEITGADVNIIRTSKRIRNVEITILIILLLVILLLVIKLKS